MGIRIQTLKPTLRRLPPCCKIVKCRRSKASFSPLAAFLHGPTVSGARLAVPALLRPRCCGRLVMPSATRGCPCSLPPSSRWRPQDGGSCASCGQALPSGLLFESRAGPSHQPPRSHYPPPPPRAPSVFSLVFLSFLPFRPPVAHPLQSLFHLFSFSFSFLPAFTLFPPFHGPSRFWDLPSFPGPAWTQNTPRRQFVYECAGL